MASSSSSEGFDETAKSFLPTSQRATYSRVPEIVAESSEIKMRTNELRAREAFGYLRPSLVKKVQDGMDTSALKLTTAAEVARSQQSEGSDIAASSKSAKECANLALLLRDLVDCTVIKADLSWDTAWTGSSLRQLAELDMRLSRAADAIDTDIKMLQQRIARL
ncbi:hypothetical protein HPB50_008459 [Hyalomma asiaticum]|uniref:Uncharacterized protein n=1 Tax=Hyalomma asiaticum TaxID=266040 RepID=A0ACB7TB53_HYAAI|nr:hypothetical protein HPB50_008459 [Hyalomma asiaticum]